MRALRLETARSATRLPAPGRRAPRRLRRLRGQRHDARPARLHQRSSSTSTSTVVTSDGTTVADALADNVAVETGDTSYDEADAMTSRSPATAAESDSDAVTIEDGTVTITAAGTYVLSGDLTASVVNSTSDGVVRLVLDDATITSDTTAAIDVVDAQSVVVVLAEGSSNALTEATTYDDTSEEAPTGALYSTADLTIGGTGSLTVTGNANNGIVGKDGLVITGGTIEVTSVDDGILGKDYLVAHRRGPSRSTRSATPSSPTTSRTPARASSSSRAATSPSPPRTTASRASRCSSPAAPSTWPGPTRPWRAR